jgi:hypothetical protein
MPDDRPAIAALIVMLALALAVLALLVLVSVADAAPSPDLLGTGVTVTGEAYSLWWVEGWPTTPATMCAGPWPLVVERGSAWVDCTEITPTRERLVIYAYGRHRVVRWEGVVIERREGAYLPEVGDD